ncbi:MAG TPA: hypothetical protein VNP04_01515 [Alphaproteobacteria bacterium]|nr:hypothetical protein [Alphaproteobacteria bacterium]
MIEPYKAIRELAQRALQSCDGNWHAAEQLIHRWLAEDGTVRQQIMEGLLEFHIRHAITVEGRRQQQHQADLRRETLIANEQAQETTQIVEELLREIERPGDVEDKGK